MFGLSNSPPNGLHHSEGHCVVVVADADRRELVGNGAPMGLEPCNQSLVSFELGNHFFAIGCSRKRPVHATLHHLMSVHVYDAHGGGEGMSVDKAVRAESVYYFPDSAFSLVNGSCTLLYITRYNSRSMSHVERPVSLATSCSASRTLHFMRGNACPSETTKPRTRRKLSSSVDTGIEASADFACESTFVCSL